MCRNNSINKNNNNNDSIQYEVPNRNNIIKKYPAIHGKTQCTSVNWIVLEYKKISKYKTARRR